MIAKDLDGNEIQLSLKNLGKKRTNKSSYHRKALELVKKIYPTLTIIEEVQVKIQKNKKLYFDIVVIERQLFIEIQGESHFEFNSYHHKDKSDFLKSQTRDDLKKEWCKINNFLYSELTHFEPKEIWESKLKNPNRP